ncbi:MAG: ATP-binding protein, partial [Saprospiraceae bacterium]|nr:ATP-binding protein [Saprospiraceae bacterium]
HSYMRECNEAFTILYGAGMPENIRNWSIGKINVELWDEMGDPYFKLFAEMGYKIEDVLIPVKIRGKQPMVLSNSVFSIINNGKIVAIWGVQRDVTKITEARKALEEKNLALQQYIQSNMQLENFAYIASHDLKAPIRTIISFSQLLQRELGERIREKEQNFLNRIIDGARGMSKLIHGLLEYSRVGGGTLSKEEIEVPKLLHEILKDLKSTIKESNAKVEIIGMPTRIEGNSTQIRQLFQNLIENGIKFKRENIPPLIRISAQQKGSCWEFAISDNGIGIKKAHHQKIFKLFQKLHDGQQYEGTGIGLALAKRIVEQHGGTISLESSPEKGSTFHFSLCQ